MTLFSLTVAFGSVFGLIWVVFESPKDEQRASLNAAIGVLLCALIGGRAAYVFVHWAYFHVQILEIPQVWLGGISWPGALAGGILGTFIMVWFYRISLGVLADRLLPLLASLSVAVWLGCWLSGCVYGLEVSRGVPVKDEWGIWHNRLPIQLISAFLTVALFWGIDRFQQRKGRLIPGLAATLGLGGFSLILFGASLLRVDPYPLYNGLRLETWAALIFLGIAVVSGGLILWQNRR